MDKLPIDTGMSLPANTFPIPVTAQRMARSLYWRGWGVSQITDELHQLGYANDETGKAFARATVDAWKQRGRWDDAGTVEKLNDSLEGRLNTLIWKEQKTGADYKEIDLLMRQVQMTAKIERYKAPGGHEGHLNDKVANRNAGPKKDKAPANHFTTEQVERLEQIFEDELFGYQEDWWAAKSERTRMILKSRQIGATWYFAREALLDALRGGGNQIFLSASKNQAHIFRGYIIQFAAKVGVKLQGGLIVLSAETLPEDEDAPQLYFLGTNARTAQGYHGNFYFDEFFWTYGFEELNKVASGMAMHKKWRRTYFSTPSTIAHQAHPYWTGERRNRRVKKADRVTIDVSHDRLKAGVLCEDNIWRQIVTIEDAEERGCDLFNLDELRIEYAPDEFANLLMCQFVDDSLSAFKFNEIQRCTVDAMVDWTDVDLLADRPVGNREVWAGDLQRAARFLYLQRLAFGGKVSGRTFGVDASQGARFNVTKLEPILADIHDRLAGVVIEQLGYADFIRRYDRPGTLFYLDPPYCGCETDYGQDVFARADFQALADQLRGIRGRFLLSINDTPGVREVFAGFKMLEFDTTYTVGKGAASKAAELVIANFDPVANDGACAARS